MEKSEHVRLERKRLLGVGGGSVVVWWKEPGDKAASITHEHTLSRQTCGS
jgi:hypothetical protein